MVPCEIFHDPLPGRAAHLLDYLRVQIKMLERVRNRIDIARPHNDALDLVADYVSRFASGDLRQCAGRSFIGDFGASLPLRGKNVHRALTKIRLRILHETEDADVVAPKFLQVTFGLLVH